MQGDLQNRLFFICDGGVLKWFFLAVLYSRQKETTMHELLGRVCLQHGTSRRCFVISSIVSIAVLQGTSKTFWHLELDKNMVYPVLSRAAVSQSQGFISVRSFLQKSPKAWRQKPEAVSKHKHPGSALWQYFASTTGRSCHFLFPCKVHAQ